MSNTFQNNERLLSSIPDGPIRIQSERSVFNGCTPKSFGESYIPEKLPSSNLIQENWSKTKPMSNVRKTMHRPTTTSTLKKRDTLSRVPITGRRLERKTPSSERNQISRRVSNMKKNVPISIPTLIIESPKEKNCETEVNVNKELEEIRSKIRILTDLLLNLNSTVDNVVQKFNNLCTNGNFGNDNKISVQTSTTNLIKSCKCKKLLFDTPEEPKNRNSFTISEISEESKKEVPESLETCSEYRYKVQDNFDISDLILKDGVDKLSTVENKDPLREKIVNEQILDRPNHKNNYDDTNKQKLTSTLTNEDQQNSENIKSHLQNDSTSADDISDFEISPKYSPMDFEKMLTTYWPDKSPIIRSHSESSIDGKKSENLSHTSSPDLFLNSVERYNEIRKYMPELYTPKLDKKSLLLLTPGLKRSQKKSLSRKLQEQLFCLEMKNCNG